MCPRIEIFGLIFPGYGLMIAIGMCVGFGLCLYYAPKHRLSRDVYVDLILCLFAGGFAGAKLLAVIVNIKSIINGSMTFMQALSVTVVYGGIIGALIVCALYCKIKKVAFWSYADLALPCATITQGIGRIGCFLAGCCYGMEYDGFGSVVFPDSPFAPSGVQLFPSQIISSVFMILFGIVSLIQCNKQKHKTGEMATNYFVVYGLARFIIEFFRGDAERGSIFGLSTSQFISIFFVAAGVAFKIARHKLKDTENN